MNLIPNAVSIVSENCWKKNTNIFIMNKESPSQLQLIMCFSKRASIYFVIELLGLQKPGSNSHVKLERWQFKTIRCRSLQGFISGTLWKPFLADTTQHIEVDSIQSCQIRRFNQSQPPYSTTITPNLAFYINLSQVLL